MGPAPVAVGFDEPRHGGPGIGAPSGDGRPLALVGGASAHPRLPGHHGGGPAGGDDAVGGLPPVFIGVLRGTHSRSFRPCTGCYPISPCDGISPMRVRKNDTAHPLGCFPMAAARPSQTNCRAWSKPMRAADSTMDEESSAALAGSGWESLAWARESQPLQQIEVENEEEGWMDHEGD